MSLFRFRSVGAQQQPVVAARGAAATKKTACVAVDDVKELRRGVQTEVLRKAGLLDPLTCLSLVTHDGYTLDLTFDTPMARDEIFRALKVLFEQEATTVRVYL
jgi:hypothetical protein